MICSMLHNPEHTVPIFSMNWIIYCLRYSNKRLQIRVAGKCLIFSLDPMICVQYVKVVIGHQPNTAKTSWLRWKEFAQQSIMCLLIWVCIYFQFTCALRWVLMPFFNATSWYDTCGSNIQADKQFKLLSAFPKQFIRPSRLWMPLCT